MQKNPKGWKFTFLGLQGVKRLNFIIYNFLFFLNSVQGVFMGESKAKIALTKTKVKNGFTTFFDICSFYVFYMEKWFKIIVVMIYLCSIDMWHNVWQTKFIKTPTLDRFSNKICKKPFWNFLLIFWLKCLMCPKLTGTHQKVP